MFFVISGIVIPLSMIKSDYKLQYWGRFLLKRFARLEPPYIAGILIAIAYFQIRRFIPGTSSEDMMITYKELLLHLGYMIPFVEGARWAVPSLWTLSIEFSILPFTFFIISTCAKIYSGQVDAVCTIPYVSVDITQSCLISFACAPVFTGDRICFMVH
jgi:peptidoglycan/LPS O-acetylase OafA/YrhL